MTAITNATDSTDVETLAQAVKDLQQTVEQQADRIEDLEATVEQQREELAKHQDHIGREFAVVRSRMTDTEETVEDLEAEATTIAAGAPDEEGKDTPETWTPLETVVSLPEEVADRELKPTQKRARFIAKDLADYGTKVPAGIRIDSRDMRRVLTAAADDGQTIYREQVKRVMNLLDDLGREEVKVRTKRGRTFVVFSEELVERARNQDRNGVRYADEAVRALQVE